MPFKTHRYIILSRNHLPINYFLNLDIDDCTENPCNNGGTCQDGIASYTCVCPLGFTGLDCETSEYKYLSLDWRDAYHYITAYHPITYLLILCMYSDIDNCQPTPCLNNGVCVDGLNSYSCDCTHGFVGENCSKSKLMKIFILSNFTHNW